MKALSKKYISWQTFLIIFSILAAVYIGFDVLHKIGSEMKEEYKKQGREEAIMEINNGEQSNEFVKQGRREAISEIITQVANENCNTVTIYLEDKSVETVNVECLREQGAGDEELVETGDEEVVMNPEFTEGEIE